MSSRVDNEEGLAHGVVVGHEDAGGASVRHGDGEAAFHSNLDIARMARKSWNAIEAGAMGNTDTDSNMSMSMNDLESPLTAVSARFGGSLRSGGRRGSFVVSNKTEGQQQQHETEETALLNNINKTTSSKPPILLVQWIGIALCCALCYALYNISIKKGSANIDPILGGVILQFVAALLGTFLLAIMMLRSRGNSKSSKKLHCDKQGLLWSIGAGLWVGTAEIVSFCVSGMGVPATASIPIIIGGSVVFGSILGVALLGEVVMWHGWSGVVLLCVGIGMVATDPGDKIMEGGGSDSGSGDNIASVPSLLAWIGPALFCALSYALYNICIKLGSASINPILGAVVLQFVAAAFGSCILAGGTFITGEQPEYDEEGIFWAFWAGMFVGGAELLSFCVSGLGVPASQSIPVLIGGSVGFGAMLGIIMLGEQLEVQGWAGVVILMTGIGIVATDPGEKLEGH